MCLLWKTYEITKSFELFISRCDDAISTVGAGSNKFFIIGLDARQRYHQISVFHIYREQLNFFAPDNQKYTFLLIPFGPTNAPGFYLDLIKNFID